MDYDVPVHTAAEPLCRGIFVSLNNILEINSLQVDVELKN